MSGGRILRSSFAFYIGFDGVGVVVDAAVTVVGGEVFCVLFSAELIENFKTTLLSASGGDPRAVDHRWFGDLFVCYQDRVVHEKRAQYAIARYGPASVACFKKSLCSNAASGSA